MRNRRMTPNTSLDDTSLDETIGVVGKKFIMTTEQGGEWFLSVSGVFPHT